QFRENKVDLSIPQVAKIGDDDKVTYDATTTTLRRAIRYFSALQGENGSWAANYGPLLLVMPPL
ncbi:hypothetical protein MKW94_017425, partial [Papaver nudicaule]|nr:hypothetical protein [Papaver nudicaule]